MALETLDWIRSIKAIENEYQVAVIAMNRLSTDAANDPNILGRDLRFRNVKEAHDKLNATYAIRMFAEFETGLRTFWVFTRIEPEPTSVAEIVNRIASKARIVGDFLINAHRVRRYRNRQIHDHQEEGEHLPVVDCRSYLNNYLSRMPMDWVAHH